MFLTLLSCGAVLCSCVEKDTEALFTDATLAVQLPDSLQMVRLQATAVFTNANTRRSIASSDFRDGVLGAPAKGNLFDRNRQRQHCRIYCQIHRRIVHAAGNGRYNAALLDDRETVRIDLLWYENSASAGADAAER